MPLYTEQPLAGQTALIFGGSGQMGKAIAAHAADLGAAAVLVGRDQKRLSEAASEAGKDSRLIVADVGSLEGTQRVFDEAGEVDHVVVATSAGARATSIPDTSPEAAQRAFGRFWTCYYAVHLAPRYVRPGGSVVLISGSSARTPAPGYGVWTTLHGAIEALARAAALELAPIRVNVASPGGIGMQPDRQLVHHRGTEGDIGAAVAALMANAAVTNAVLDVDGGERLGTWSGE